MKYRPEIDGQLLYFDTNHLSNFGTAMIVDEFFKALETKINL